MIIFLMILFLLGFLFTLINLSLSEKKYVFIFAVIMAVISFATFPAATDLNIKGLKIYMNDMNLLSYFCTYQIVESVAMMFFVIVQIENYFNDNKKKFYKYLSFFPSLIFLAGIFLLQTGIFYFISSVDYYLISLLFSAGLFVTLFVCPFAVKKIISMWESRMELKILTSFLQIIISMFLPILITGAGVSESPFRVDVGLTIGVLLFVFFITGTGLVLHRIGFNKRILRIVTSKK